MNRVSCGCCSNGCVCSNHCDIPNGLQVKICAKHTSQTKVVGYFTFTQDVNGNWYTTIAKRIGFLVCENLIAVKDADGSTCVYRSDGTWLGWNNPSGATMSMGNPSREGEDRVYSAGQAAKYL